MQVMEIQIQIKIYEGNMALTRQMQFIGGVSGKWENMTKPFKEPPKYHHTTSINEICLFYTTAI